MKFHFLLLVLVVTVANAANWPSWRGPHNDGICDEIGLPTTWNVAEKKNIVWSVELPDRGNSTPVVWGDKLFITQSVESAGKKMLLCFDKKTGKQLWENGIIYNEQETTHGTNPLCSGSPVTDGERVIVNFASAGVCCYDLNGKEVWHQDLGPQQHIWGSGTSPVIVGDLCLLNHGPGVNAKLVAMDKKTGKVLWEHAEPIREGDKDGERGFYGSWSDPLPRVINGRAELLMSWPYRVCSMDPRTGKDFWTCEGLNPLCYTSPLLAKDIVVSMGGYSGKALAVKVGGAGDVTSTHRLWHQPKSPQRIGSGAVHEGHVYILNDPGIAQCIDVKTGEIIWTERLKGDAPTAQNWSSIVISEGNCYAVNQGGDAFVFKASPKFELVATNPMGEKVIGSIAVSDGRLFIRGHRHLFCVAGK
jgi:outer membrane protein assembly factor BamB